METWLPTVPEGPQPFYDRLVQALSADIDAGHLARGQRLPPQRDLAYRLGVSLGAVTRAYAQAERQGLISGQVGRGSFVRDRTETDPAAGPIDLARNLPPLEPARRRFAAALTQAARRPELASQLDYPPEGGFEAQRRAGATWLSRAANLPAPDWRELMVCAGAQQASAVALGALCRPGDTVIAEAATFAGLRTLAAHAGYRLAAAGMDAQGLTPAELERAAVETSARVAYVLPLQNPTGRIMGLQRRHDLVTVARKRGLMLVEDDLYGALTTPLALPPLAALAPERVCYIGGLSKSLAPGLRIGYLRPPADLLDACLEAMRAIAFSAPTLTGLIAQHWIEDGQAFEILDAVRTELAARAGLARAILGDLVEPSPLAGPPHMWVPMGELAAERLAGRLLREGVAITPPRAHLLPGSPVTGVRLCLGAAADRAQLEPALRAVKTAMESGERPGRDAV
jgi:DNA-binding transcriptional MocR family regulator